MATRITDKFVRDLTFEKKGKSRLILVFDDTQKGFGIRVTEGGSKAFVLDYRIDGRQRRMTLGRYPDWSVAAAREEAKRIRRMVNRGEDPLGARHARREAPTVQDMADRYLEEHAPKKRESSRKYDRIYIDKHILPRIGRKKVADVTFTDIDKIHREMKGTPYQANRVHSLVRKMFALAIRWGYRDDNPAVGVERYPEQKRERFLLPEELAKLSDALGKLPNQITANAIRLLILTGARRGEVLAAEWDQFNLGEGVWVKPSAHTKQKKEHRVPLSPPALDLLSKMKDRAGDRARYVFPGHGSTGHITEIKKAWAAACKIAGLKGVRIHDLRHTYASLLASSGHSLPIIGSLLGHTQASTTQRYTHLMDSPLREATNRVGAIVTGDKEGEVIPFAKKSS